MSDTIALRESLLGKEAIVRSLNHYLRSHWAKNKRKQKTYQLIIRNQMNLNNIRTAEIDESFYLHITSYRKRLLDHDNLYGSHKWLIDALCNEQFIFDDDPTHCIISIDQHTIAKQSKVHELTTLITRRPMDDTLV